MVDPSKDGFFLKAKNDKDFYAHHWAIAKPKAVLLLVHGFAEHTHRYEHVYQELNEAGITCLGIDLFGHGRTEGLKGHVDRFELFLDQLEAANEYLKQKYPNLPLLLYGHSMGGNVVLNYLFKNNPTVDGVIVTSTWIDLANPAPAVKVWLGRRLRNILPRMTQQTELNAHLLSRDTKVGEAYIADPLVQTKMSNAMGIDVLQAATFLREYAGVATCPLLLMHGDADGIISAQGTKELANRLRGDVTLKIWPEMYHEIQNEIDKEKVIAFAINWVEAHILINK